MTFPRISTHTPAIKAGARELWEGRRTFVLFFSIQFLSYGIVTWNFRAIAQARYLHLFVSDLGCAYLGYTLLKKIQSTESWVAKAGYVLGGACGSVLSTFITKQIFGS